MWNKFKGMLGFENLEVIQILIDCLSQKVADAPEDAQPAAADENQKKGLFASLSGMIGKDITRSFYSNYLV